MQRLLNKTALMMHTIDASIPDDLARMARVDIRHGFYGDGYARSNDAAENAIALANDQLGLSLDTTYTGKAMAALLHDAANGTAGQAVFWNTYNSNPLPGIDEGGAGPRSVTGRLQTLLRLIFIGVRFLLAPVFFLFSLLRFSFLAGDLLEHHVEPVVHKSFSSSAGSSAMTSSIISRTSVSVGASGSVSTVLRTTAARANISSES